MAKTNNHCASWDMSSILITIIFVFGNNIGRGNSFNTSASFVRHRNRKKNIINNCDGDDTYAFSRRSSSSSQAFLKVFTGSNASDKESCLHAVKNKKVNDESHEKIAEQESNNSADDTGWDMKEDWMLQDQVALFTVVSSGSSSISHHGRGKDSPNTAVTFWTQLRHSTPLLSHRSEKDLENRYKILYDQNRSSRNENSNNNDNNSGKAATKEMVQCGPSPEFLTDWWMEEYSSSPRDGSGTVMVGGALMNGRNIWFPLKHAGELFGARRESNNDYAGEGSNAKYFNYAEAIGGFIYELGTPRAQHSNAIESNLHIKQTDVDRKSSSSSMMNWLWISRNSAVISIIAASVLSALIAFSSDPLQHQSMTCPYETQVANNNPSPPITVVLYGKRSEVPSSSGTGATELVELSTSAQRARQELRVERDKMTISRIQDKLKLDELKLKELQQEEMRLEANEYGFR